MKFWRGWTRRIPGKILGLSANPAQEKQSDPISLGCCLRAYLVYLKIFYPLVPPAVDKAIVGF
jgi:hypothetical protein